jgi:hypothetical protein
VSPNVVPVLLTVLCACACACATQVLGEDQAREVPGAIPQPAQPPLPTADWPMLIYADYSLARAPACCNSLQAACLARQLVNTGEIFDVRLRLLLCEFGGGSYCLCVTATVRGMGGACLECLHVDREPPRFVCVLYISSSAVICQDV